MTVKKYLIAGFVSVSLLVAGIELFNYYSGLEEEKNQFHNMDCAGVRHFGREESEPTIDKTENNEPQDGFQIFQYDNGAKFKEGNLQQQKEEGRWTYWHRNGQKSMQGKYKQGIKEGFWTYWYEDGKKQKQGNYRQGREDGRWTYWYESGKKHMEGRYNRGEKEGWWVYKGTKSTVTGNYNNGQMKGVWTVRAKDWVRRIDNAQESRDLPLVVNHIRGERDIDYSKIRKELEKKYKMGDVPKKPDALK